MLKKSPLPTKRGLQRRAAMAQLPPAIPLKQAYSADNSPPHKAEEDGSDSSADTEAVDSDDQLLGAYVQVTRCCLDSTKFHASIADTEAPSHSEYEKGTVSYNCTVGLFNAQLDPSRPP